jgi:hypothetical protein
MSVQQNGHRSQAAASTLRFQPNVAEEVALKFRDGRDVEGAYGPQVMFTLVDGRKLYLNPGPAERIRELGLRPGEFFSICKRQSNGNSVRWEVTRLDPPATSGNGAAAHDAPRAPAYRSNLERQLAKSIEQVERAKANGAANGYNGGSSAGRAQPPAQSRPLPTALGAASAVAVEAATITSMLRLSVDALVSTQSYAKKQHGVELAFNEEDVRAIATTLFITATREAGWR